MRFTKILLDAPCSGNYVTDRDWFEKRELDGIRRNAELQKGSLRQPQRCSQKEGH
jgi:16S rRNA C967 or C1407 C5-methylase (RsmB/RsmF family)